MSALQFTAYGPASDFVLAEDTAAGAPGEGQILVQVAAASINPIDTAISAGYLAEMLPLELPATVGGDYAGTVLEVGPGVEHVSVGDRVIGQAGLLLGGSGSFAEKIVAPAGLATRAPQNADAVTAAALPLAGASAVQALRTLGLTSGQTLLVLGAGGAIGSYGVQIGKAAGLRVLATAGAADLEYVRSLGADEVIDYSDTAAIDALTGIDGILDASRGVDPAPYYRALNRGGAMVSLGTQHDEEAAKAAGVSGVSQMTAPATDVLDELVALVDAGKVAPRIAGTFPLSQGVEAFAADASSRGKTVVTMGA